MSESGKDYGVLSEIRSKGLHVYDSNGHYYLEEAEKISTTRPWIHTWAFIHAKLWSVLLTNGFKLEKEEPSRWTFVRTVQK